VADNVSELLSNTTPKAQVVNEFIASKDLQDLIKNAVKDGVIDGQIVSRKTKQIEGILEKSEAYKKWADTLDGSDKAKLVSMGTASYLLTPDKEETP